MSHGDIAIVGMACVFPGAADMTAYWRNIVNGVDAVGELPPDRWPGSRATEIPRGHEARVTSTRGGFIPTPLRFDATRYRVMPNVARHGDPDQFLLLDVLGRALRDAGLPLHHPARRETDLIVGRGGYTSNKMLEVFLRGDGIDRMITFLGRRLPELGDADLERLAAEMRATLPPYDVDGLATAIPNLVASRAANRLDLGGAAFTVDAACASSLIAVENAVQRLRDGRCDVALAAGVNFTHIPAFWFLFSRILAMSPTGTIRPFDRRADGMVIGEGAGALVLKRLEDAIRDGDRAHAVLKGVGSASDGGAAGVLAPSSPGQVRAVERAYADGGVEPATIGYLEAHGTGTRLGDSVELETVAKVFGPPRGTYGARVIGSVKSMIGHTMPASGMASLIKTALALSNKVLPPSLHCDQPHPALAGTDFFVTGRARPWLEDPSVPRRAGVNAFGFGGVNAHVVLEEAGPGANAPTTVTPGANAPTRVTPGANAPTTVTTPCGSGTDVAERPLWNALDRPSELLVFSADDEEALAARLRETARFLEEDRAPFELEEVAYTLACRAEASARCRLALVRDSVGGLGDELRGLADRLVDGGLTADEREGVFYREPCDEEPGSVAAIFPGIAFPGLVGEFPQHLLTNCLHFPSVRRVFDRIEARDGRADDPLPTSFLLAPPAYLPAEERARLQVRFGPPPTMREGEVFDPAPTERNLSSMGMLANNWASWRFLQALGVPVDMLCGQSLGDISAVMAAGVIEFEPNIAKFWEIFDLDIPYENNGCIGVVGTTEEALRPYLAELPDVTIGIHLSPTTLVVGGSEDDVKTLCDRLREANVLAQRLPFPPIHTPRLEKVQEDFVAALEKVAEPAVMRPPRITIYSGLRAAPMPDDPAEIRELIRTNVSRPVRFWQTIRRMYDDGARFIVQIGSGTMAANSQSILGEDDAVCVAMDVAHRDPVTQIQRLCGRLFVRGLAVDLPALFVARRPSELPLDAPRPAPEAPPDEVSLTLYWPPLHHDPHDAPPPPSRGVRKTVAEPGTPSEPPSRLPFIGDVVVYEPGVRITVDTRLDLDEQLYLADHVFIHARPHKPLRECFPVVPLTMTLEILAECAACLAPGLGLIGFERVRARRWIAFEEVDAVDLRVRAEVLRGDLDDGAAVAVRAEVLMGEDVAASAVVRFSTHYRETLAMQFAELTDPRPLPATARELYERRVLFHGPRFQSVAAVAERGAQGITGELVVRGRGDLFRSVADPELLTDPAVLDGAGQMVGAYFLGAEGYLLPIAVDRIEFYRPAPEPGTPVPIRVEFTEIDLEARRTSAKIEVQDGGGRVWFRIEGWQDVVFHWKESVLRTLREPSRYTLAAERPLPGLPSDAVATLLPHADVRDLQEDWLARAYLSSAEWATYRAPGFTPMRRRAWLLGRVAAKDAVRLWVAARHGSEALLHPAQITLGNDDDGRPRVLAIEGSDALPDISLSHGDWGAAAAAGDAPLGIDVEPAGAAEKLDPETFVTPAEIGRLRECVGDLERGDWMTRLWCAKEAASKALGRGLEGGPRAWEAVDVDVSMDGDGFVSIHARGAGERVEVWTSREGDLVLAFGRAPSAVALRRPT